MLVSHDRQLLANAAQRVVAVEDRDVWVHGEGFATFASARAARIDRIDELRRRWAEEHRRLRVVAAWSQPFDTLSGGQQARLQILLLELSGETLLLLDEPTDNLDLASADALQHGLREFTGTVLAITHDRWFAADFDRYLHFTRAGDVREVPEPIWC